ncbi:MAG: tetratricopeptide repeat protein, partial [Planctomycetota bacterium]
MLEETTVELQRSTLRTELLEAGQAKPTKWSRRLLPCRPAGKPILQPTAGPIKAIVVLPFENLSGDPEQEYFVDGMTDALSAELGKIKALRVISRTSAMHYKDTDKVISEIVKELGVDAVIEGSVLKAGNDVRVTAQLVDGRTDAHLWSDNYTGTLTNILALQSKVTLAIAQEIEVAVTPEEEAHITRTEPVKPEAYEAYLKGRFFMEKQTEESMKMAAVYFQRAIDIEPEYAEAYAKLSGAYWVPSIYEFTRPHDSFPIAKTAVSTAIALDESVAEAHVAIGWIALFYDWEWQTAKESFEQAIQLNPSLIEAHHGLAWYWVIAGRFDEAIDSMQTAVKLDPLSPLLNARLGGVYFHSGQFERALAQYKEALKLDPSHLPALLGLADYYLGLSMYAEAEESIEKAMDKVGRIPDLVCLLGQTYAKSDRKDEARKLLEELLETDRSKDVLPGSLALLYAALGETDEALKWLEKAHLEHSFEMVWLRISHGWPPHLRSDPRFEDLVRRMNFPEAPDSEPAAKPVEVAQAPIEKIAVLPFTSISSESGEEWFVDGMTDALITQLGKIKALTVISRTSAMQYKNVSKPMREIAQDLGVDALVEGSVIRAGDDVQVTARLIDGRTDERIWGDFFQGTLSNILALQSEVTLAIARQIEATLTPEEEQRITRTEPVNP